MRAAEERAKSTAAPDCAREQHQGPAEPLRRLDLVSECLRLRCCSHVTKRRQGASPFHGQAAVPKTKRRPAPKPPHRLGEPPKGRTTESFRLLLRIVFAAAAAAAALSALVNPWTLVIAVVLA